MANNSAIAFEAAYGLSGSSGLVSDKAVQEGAYTCDVLTFRILGGDGRRIAASKTLYEPMTLTLNVSLGSFHEAGTEEIPARW
jgi:hypothetical protein